MYKIGIIQSSRGVITPPTPPIPGGPDYMPDYVKYGLVNYNKSIPFYTYSSQRITGISNPGTTIMTSYDQTAGIPAPFNDILHLYYRVDTAKPDPIPNDDPINLGFSFSPDLGLISVAPNEWLTFGVRPGPDWPGDDVIYTTQVNLSILILGQNMNECCFTLSIDNSRFR